MFGNQATGPSPLRRRVGWLAAALLLLASGLAVWLLLAGGGSARSLPYTLSATEDCLFRSAAQLSYAEADADSVGQSAPGGGVGVTLPQNQVTLGFERNSGDAHDPLRGALLFGASLGPKLHTDRNTYVSWDYTPTANDKRTVEGCLTAGSGSRLSNRYPAAVTGTLTTHCEQTPTSSPQQAERLVAYCVCAVDTIQARYSESHVEQIGFSSPPIKQITDRCSNDPNSDPARNLAHTAPAQPGPAKQAAMVACGDVVAYGAYSIRSNSGCPVARLVAIDASFCQGGQACRARGYTCIFTGLSGTKALIRCVRPGGRRITFNYH